MLPSTCARNGKQSELDGKEQDQNRAESEIGKRQSEQAYNAEQAVVPPIASLCRAHSCGNREKKSHNQGGNCEAESIGIAIPDDTSNILVQANRLPQSPV